MTTPAAQGQQFANFSVDKTMESFRNVAKITQAIRFVVSFLCVTTLVAAFTYSHFPHVSIAFAGGAISLASGFFVRMMYSERVMRLNIVELKEAFAGQRECVDDVIRQAEELLSDIDNRPKDHATSEEVNALFAEATTAARLLRELGVDRNAKLEQCIRDEVLDLQATARYIAWSKSVSGQEPVLVAQIKSAIARISAILNSEGASSPPAP